MTSTKNPRLALADHPREQLGAVIRVEEPIKLAPSVRRLVKLRASLVNGCSIYIDMHWAEARAAGEPEVRLAQLAAWADSPYYDDPRERAALALTDAMTHVSVMDVPDDVWAEAERHFAPDELADLVIAIGAINLWNRVEIATRALRAGDGPAAEAA
jgi:AhpD family alkylhydroperoxidase